MVMCKDNKLAASPKHLSSLLMLGLNLLEHSITTNQLNILINNYFNRYIELNGC